MSDLADKTVSNFISETDCSNLFDSRDFQSIVRLKVFNGENQTDLDRTVIISIESTNKDQINQCLEEIRSFNFPWAESFHSDITINER